MEYPSASVHLNLALTPSEKKERDVAQWSERSFMVRWVVGLIPHGGPIELFLVTASAPRLV